MYYVLFDRCEKGAYLLLSVIRQITRVMDIYEKRPYNNDNMVVVMKQTLNELKKDYLKEHLKKQVIFSFSLAFEPKGEPHV